MGLNIENLESYKQILHKLEVFLTRYHGRQLIKGTFLFLFLGGLLALAIGGLEYFLWLSSGLRTLLLWLGVLLEAFLLVRYIAMPLLQLMRLRKGLSLKEGSTLIGKHFPNVSDKLYNLLELAEQPEKTELLLASIEQRSAELRQVPFQRAIDMKQAYRYARFAAIPLLVFGLIWVSGKGLDFINSYERVVNYEMAYQPPAPFRFELLTPDLRQREDKAFVLKVATPGDLQPEEVRLLLNGTPIIMEARDGFYQYTFQPPLSPASFRFQGGGVDSRMYELQVLRIPVIDQFEMEFRYPDYLGMQPERVQGSGNARLPEGTSVRWRLRAYHADSLRYSDRDTTLWQPADRDEVSFRKRVWNSMDYQISASNADIGEYDKLRYRFEVIPDAFPGIEVAMEQDSLNPNQAYFMGTLSDDHGLRACSLVVYPAGRDDEKQTLEIPVPEASFHTFYYTFPSGLDIEQGRTYTLYFTVRDNDGNRGGKVRRSREFTLNVLDARQLEDQQLEYQNNLIQGLDKATEAQDRLNEDMKALQQNRKEKRELEFEDKNRLKDFMKRWERQEQLMQKFSKELSESMEEETPSESQELLKERLERQEARARENAALMEEIQEVLDKLDKEDFEQRMEDISRAQQGSQRSMKQLLELTKRYYVQQKSRQLSRELKRAADTQEELANKTGVDSSSIAAQDKLNEAFKDLRKELEGLEKDNQALQKPMPWERDVPKEAAVEKEQGEAASEMKEVEEKAQDTPGGDTKPSETKRKQQGASRKLQEMSEALSQGGAMGGAQSIEEDAEMLRQILDNLVDFSLEQESLFQHIQEGEGSTLNHAADIKKQKELRALFEHVDDSLFALSLRRAEISEVINEQITEVYYNLDKGLENMENNNWFRGASYQQYVITASNELSAFLADMLDNLQQSMMPGQGQGQGADFQLPDIIQSQEQLRQMASGSKGKKGQEQGSEGQGQGKAEGASGKEGSEGDQQGEGRKSQEGDSGTGKQGERQGGSQAGEKSGQQGGEEGYAEAFEIYKEQQRIRRELEKQLEDMISEADRELAKKIAREMELFEEELLRSGITERTTQRLNRIQQQLMQLENAALEQGEDQKRTSTSNQELFKNPVLTPPDVFQRSQREVEILNREALPLQQIYRDRVRMYFRQNDSVPPSGGL